MEQKASTAFDLAQTTYRWLNEYAPQGVFTTDAQLCIVSWNHWLVINSSLSRDDTLGRNLLSLFPELTERELDKHYQTALKGQVVFLSQQMHGYLLPMPPKINRTSYRQMQQRAHIAPLLASDRVVGTLTVIEDVTDRLAREAATRESEARYHSLFEGVPIGLYRTTPDGRILDVNAALALMLGYPDKETLLAKTAVDLYAAAHLREEWQSELASRDEIYHLEVQLYRYDGSQIWAEDIARAIRNEAGEIIFYDGSLKEITERKEAELSLKRREQELASVIAHLPEGVLLLDGEHRIVMSNPTAEEALPLLLAAESPTLTQLGDKSLAELEKQAAGQPWHEVKALQGERLFEVTAVPIPGEDGASHVGCIVVLRDVTEERQRQDYQAAQERLAVVGQMAAGIAHDFNNIMAAVVLYAQMMERAGDLSPRHQRYVKTIEEQANRAADLTRQMLDFSRRSVLLRQELNILPFLKEMYKLLERTLPENIDIRLVYDNSDYIINVDPTRFQQILMNLALNARDAMVNGGKLTISVSRLSLVNEAAAPISGMTAGEWLTLAVTDTGCGIDKAALSHIYEPFFTTKSPDKGTGLGLSQVYGIVKQHDGFIDVSSQVGVGTTFVIYLPLAERPSALAKAADAIELIRGAGETILVVEDNAPTRLAICEVLAAAGYETIAAENGREALELYDRTPQRISLVISDLVMPVMSGDMLFAALKERAPWLKIIVITGYPLEGQNRQMLEKGVVGWLQKPFTTKQVTTAVAQAIGSK